VFAYWTSWAGKYFGDQPERSIQTFSLCRQTEIASSCQGKEGCASTICRSGKSAATSSRHIGFEYFKRKPPPPGTPVPMPLWPEWKRAGRPASAITSYSGYAPRSFGKNACRLGWNLKPFTRYSEISRRARSTASGRAGSTLAKAINTSAFVAAASAISSFGIGGIPLFDSQSTVKTTAAILRSR
jgi:hypothetical protein